MGEVYRARDTRLNREIALKVLPAELAGDASRRQRFEQEARSAGSLNHPNIVAVYDVGEEDGVAFLVTELVEGESLRDVIGRGPLPPRKVQELGTQIAEGLAAAHAAGIVHRDLKPDNVMIARDGRARILDFGLAKQTAPAGQSDATRTQTEPGMIAGTVGYMAPEQVRGLAVDYRADIFSFGLVLYEMIGGRRAFARGTSVETLSSILNDEPAELPSETPPALAAVVLHCLEKDAGRRFQSAHDLAFALRSLSGRSSSGLTPGPATPKARARWLGFAAAAVAVAAALAAGFLLRGRLDVTAPPTFQQLTFRRGSLASAYFAPDGHSIVYSASWDMHPVRAYLQPIGNPEARDMGFPDGSMVASVSPRGDIALLRGQSLSLTPHVLARSSLAGEPPRDLLDDVLFADWAPDGASLACVRRAGSRMRLEYPVGTVLNESPYILSPRISPDGKRVAFFRNHEIHWYLSVADRSGKTRDLLMIAGMGSLSGEGLAWSRDGREIWYTAADPTKAGQIHAADLKGNTRVVARLPGPVNLQDIARDGRVLISTGVGRLGIVFGDGKGLPRDLSWLQTSLLNDISADGKTILFTELGEGGGTSRSVYLRPTDGSPAVRLGPGFGYKLSRDGKWSLVLRFASEHPAVLVPTGAGQEKALAVDGLSEKQHGIVEWFPDGRVLLWAGEFDGKKRLYIGDLSGGRPAPFGPAVATKSLLSPDARECVIKDGTGHFAIYPTDGSAARPIAGLTSDDHVAAWSSDGRALFLQQEAPDRMSFSVSRLDLATGRRTPFAQIQPGQPVGRLSNLMMTTDGAAWAFNYQSEVETLYLVKGWK